MNKLNNHCTKQKEPGTQKKSHVIPFLWHLQMIPGLGRYPGEGSENPLQNSCLKIPMDSGAWWAAVHGVTKSWASLSTHSLTSQQAKQSLVSEIWSMVAWIEGWRLTTRKHKETFWKDTKTLFVDCGHYIDITFSKTHQTALLTWYILL